jgi:predicted MFS family arabinose efflux permease
MGESLTERHRRMVLPTLIVAVSSIDTPSVIVNISLIEIALSFGVSISLAGQIRSVTSTLGIFTALAMGVISVRYDYRTLLLTGIVINLLAALLCSTAPSFGFLLASFSAMGLVTSLVTPMVFAYIGEYYPEERRPKTIGLLAAARTLIYLAMVQLVGYVAANHGWRNAFLSLVAPFTLVGLALSFVVLPSARGDSASAGSGALKGYREVLGSASAKACLLGNSLAAASWMAVVLYSVSYLRERFLLSHPDASLIFSVLGVGVLVGNYAGGLLAARLGRRRVASLGSLLTGLSIVGYMNSPSVAVTLIVVPLMSVGGGIVLTSANSLVLEQAPRFRGTMMSVNSAASQLGIALGAGAGGLALHLFGWGAVGLLLGAMKILASLVYRHGVKEPGDSTHTSMDARAHEGERY